MYNTVRFLASPFNSFSGLGVNLKKSSLSNKTLFRFGKNLISADEQKFSLLEKLQVYIITDEFRVLKCFSLGFILFGYFFLENCVCS